MVDDVTTKLHESKGACFVKPSIERKEFYEKINPKSKQYYPSNLRALSYSTNLDISS
jgi:hypothetical protein